MIYDFNLNNAAIQNLPPDKRQPKNIALLQGLLSSLQVSRDAFFGTYYTNDLSKRILYNGSKIVMEYALNTRFGGSFVQPPGTSLIYTTKISSVAAGFVVGETDDHSSSVGLTEAYGIFNVTNQDTIGLNNIDIYLNNFTINIPSTLYDAIADTNDQRNTIINQFVNTYIPHGMHFTITLI